MGRGDGDGDGDGRQREAEALGMPLEGVCVVCQGRLERPLRAYPCAHSLCSVCMCDHVTHSAARRPRCPTCRSPITRAEVSDAGDPSAWYMTLRYRNIAFYLDIRTENSEGTGVERPFSRLGQLFRMPRERMKLIHRGRLVSEEDSVRALAATGATLTLVGSRIGDEELLQRSWRGLLNSMWGRAAMTMDSLTCWALPLLHLLRAFVASVDPRWKADEEQQ